jgi:molecular chaperone DnaK (HSP70)
MSTLIERNSKIPTSHTENFTTFVDHQTHVDIHVLQGERPTVAENQSLARFRLGPLEPLPAGMPRISVKFLIDADGILQVSARDLRTGLAQAMEVKPSLGWNPEQIESHLKVTEIERISDQRKRREVEVRMEAERVLRQVEKRLPEGRLVLSPEEVTKVEARVATLRSALAQPFGSADLLKIQEARYALNDGTVRMAEQLLARAMEQARQKSDKKAQLPENLS